MIEAVLDDGTVLEFPEDTDDEVINQAVKDYLESIREPELVESIKEPEQDFLDMGFDEQLQTVLSSPLAKPLEPVVKSAEAVFELGKAVQRGFGKGLLSAGAGLA